MKRVALAIIRNETGEYLLQHKDESAPNNPNTWCLFGGAVEPDESPEEAIKREVKEELLEELTVSKLVAHEPDPQNGIERYYFLADWALPIERLRAQLQEGDDVGYFRAELIQDLAVNTAHAAVISALHAN